MLGTQHKVWRYLFLKVLIMSRFDYPSRSPPCFKCGAAMKQASLIPGMSTISRHAFECARCENVEIISESKFTLEKNARSG
jgi:hypothetical protein